MLSLLVAPLFAHFALAACPLLGPRAPLHWRVEFAEAAVVAYAFDSRQVAEYDGDLASFDFARSHEVQLRVQESVFGEVDAGETITLRYDGYKSCCGGGRLEPGERHLLLLTRGADGELALRSAEGGRGGLIGAALAARVAAVRACKRICGMPTGTAAERAARAAAERAWQDGLLLAPALGRDWQDERTFLEWRRRYDRPHTRMAGWSGAWTSAPTPLAELPEAEIQRRVDALLAVPAGADEGGSLAAALEPLGRSDVDRWLLRRALAALPSTGHFHFTFPAAAARADATDLLQAYESGWTFRAGRFHATHPDEAAQAERLLTTLLLRLAGPR